MIINKYLETYIDLNDPFEIYSNEPEQTIIKKLNAKYLGVCTKSCYVMEIVRVVRRSYIYMKDTLKGGSSVCVLFEAKVLVYNQNEIICDCKIIKKEAHGKIHGVSKYAGIQLQIDPSISIFSAGDVVPVRVRKVRYNVNENKISISAIPFLPIKAEPIKYDITTELSKEEKSLLSGHLDDIDKCEALIKKFNATQKKVFKFFFDMLSEKRKKPIKKSSQKPLREILNMKGVISKPKYQDKSIVVVENSKDPDKISEAAYAAMYSIIIERLTELQTLLTLVDCYPDFKSVQKNKSVWKLYMLQKN